MSQYNLEHIHMGFTDWESELFTRFAPERSHVLVLGCSTGREVLALAKKGCLVEGVDPSEVSLKIAREQILKDYPNVLFKNQDLQSLSFENQKYDLIFLTGFIYGYVMGRADRIAILRKLKSSLLENF